MAALAEMSLETASCLPRKGQVVLTNIETNNRCAYTNTCTNCYLNLVQSGTVTLPEDTIFEATTRLIKHGAEINHLVLSGKEPFESPELLMRIAHQYHSTPFGRRPASFGALSASVSGINHWLPRMPSTPLSWLAVSVDVDGSGLRAGDPFRVLNAAMKGRDAGGTEAVAVNTTFQESTLEAVAFVGESLRGKSIDQWTTSPLMLPVDGRMTSTATYSTTCRMIELASRLVDVASRVVVETELPFIRRMIGEDRWGKLDLHVWRIEVQLESGVWLFARSPAPGFFLRIRHDGALLSKEDFVNINLKIGSYGMYTDPTDIDLSMDQLRQEREMGGTHARLSTHERISGRRAA